MDNNMNEQQQAAQKSAKARKSLLLNRLLLAASVVLFAAGVWLLVRQYVFIPDAYVAPPTPTVAPASPGPTAAAAVTTPSPTPYVKKIPVTLHFTERAISCPIEPVGIVNDVDKKGNPILDENGEPVKIMGTIDSEKVAAWLEEGPSPGEPGNAIINGHIRWKKVAGVFSVLSDMAPGEKMAVTYDDGSVTYFAVASVDVFTIDDWPAWVMEQSGDTRMTLITCHGEWNSSQGTSNERVIVVAKPVDEQSVS
ncbi:MAG: class F sortase [Candidatus Pelethousia sp.]|nr:class F sortase [Candidatus Pelethousia sp.]